MSDAGQLLREQMMEEGSPLRESLLMFAIGTGKVRDAIQSDTRPLAAAVLSLEDLEAREWLDAFVEAGSIPANMLREEEAWHRARGVHPHVVGAWGADLLADVLEEAGASGDNIQKARTLMADATQVVCIVMAGDGILITAIPQRHVMQCRLAGMPEPDAAERERRAARRRRAGR